MFGITIHGLRDGEEGIGGGRARAKEEEVAKTKPKRMKRKRTVTGREEREARIVDISCLSLLYAQHIVL